MVPLGVPPSPQPYQDSTLIADEKGVFLAISDEVKVVNGQLVKVQNVQSINLNSTTQNWLFERIEELKYYCVFYFVNNGVNDWIKSNAQTAYINKLAVASDSLGLLGKTELSYQVLITLI